MVCSKCKGEIDWCNNCGTYLNQGGQVYCIQNGHVHTCSLFCAENILQGDIEQAEVIATKTLKEVGR